MSWKELWWKDEKWHVNGPDSSFNVMELARRVCTMKNIDAICEEALEFGKREGENPSERMSFLSHDEKDMWRRTDQLKGKTGKTKGTIRFSFPKNKHQAKSARGGPRYGISVPLAGGAGRIIEVVVHEICHVIHLSRFNEAHINGKRRPHDLVFNRIFLKVMQPIMGLKESETNPFKMGYSVGRGYAPSRKIEKMLEKQIKENGDAKIMDLFKHPYKSVVPKVKKKSMPTGWINHLADYVNSRAGYYFGEETKEEILEEYDDALVQMISKPRNEGGFVDVLKHKIPVPEGLVDLVCKCLDEIDYWLDYEANVDSFGEYNPYKGYQKTVDKGSDWFLKWRSEYDAPPKNDPVGDFIADPQLKQYGKVVLHDKDKKGQPVEAGTLIQFCAKECYDPNGRRERVKKMIELLDIHLKDTDIKRGILIQSWKTAKKYPQPCLLVFDK